MKLAFSKGLNYLYIGAGHYRLALSDFFFRKPTIVLLSISVLLNILTWSIVIILNKSLGDNLAILHYNVIFGIDRIGSARSLYEFPIMGLVLLIANFLIGAILVRKREHIPGYQLLVTAMLGNLLLLVALYVIYVINFS